MGRLKKMAPVADQSDGGAKSETAGGGFDPTISSNVKICQDQAPPKPPFTYVDAALARWQQPARPSSAQAAWLSIVAQLRETRPAVVYEHHFDRAICRLDHGRLVVVPPSSAGAEWLAELASGRTRPLQVAVAMAGLGALQVDVE